MRRFIILLATVAAVSSGSPIANADEPLFSWSGIYLGAHAGNAISERETHLPVPFPASIDPQDRNGWFGGGLAGFSVQSGPWVLGAEIDVAFGSDGPRQTVFQPASTVAWHQYTKTDLLASARGRVGYATDRWHLFGTGGVAWAQTSATIVATDGALETGRGSADATHLGWVAGVGVEYAASANWALRIEYLHYDLDNADYNYSGVPGAATSADLTIDTVRGAVTYKFR